MTRRYRNQMHMMMAAEARSAVESSAAPCSASLCTVDTAMLVVSFLHISLRSVVSMISALVRIIAPSAAKPDASLH